MSKAAETLDTTISSSILAVIALVFMGSLFASAAPVHAPSTNSANVSYALHESSDGINIVASGGRLKK